MSTSPVLSQSHAVRKQTVLLLGGTGLVGSACLRLLARDDRVSEVRQLVRRASGAAVTGSVAGTATNRVVEHVIDYDWPDADAEVFDVDAVICALGTTIRTAGSQAAFRKVDYEYPLRIAGIARRHGAAHFAIVTAIGADPQARTFYSRVKGNVEEGLKKLDYPTLTIVRPSFLMGERTESRPLESVARRVGLYLPLKWRSVSVERVARALVTEVLSDDTRGVNVIENDALHRAPPLCR
ncbi:NAD(P)H-binding protein [Paraburkholderia sp. DHOC27]|uniref:NAD(P)H-binding protein n=1 Tax=Paraburkholderia sp. DHOC27 TaxID=2303330 RepID=UPI000E3C1D33|nr:NAD(P)H-binding protein [Paraburkholderia sp. DHOC27]RFU46070.1 NAD-dependent epimerase/dehydratase family protein [Paraburkholderia sp. DHOC27]